MILHQIRNRRLSADAQAEGGPGISGVADGEGIGMGSRRCAPTRRTAAPAASRGTATSGLSYRVSVSSSATRPRCRTDFDELIAAIAPRSVLIVEPTMDRTTTPADVRQAVERARKVYSLYSAADRLALQEPVDYTRLTSATQDRAVQWMNQIHSPSPVPVVK